MPNRRRIRKKAPRISFSRKGSATDILVEGATALLVFGGVAVAYIAYLILLH